MRPVRTALALSLAMFAFAGLARTAFAQTAAPAPAPVVTPVGTDTVEEDWAIVVNTPNPTEGAPQFATFMSPVTDQSASYALLRLNGYDQPVYNVGGIQSQIWTGDSKTCLASSPTTVAPATNQLATANETISWTQRLQYNVAKGQITFAVVNATTATWGNFSIGSGLGKLHFTAPATGVMGYSSTVSMKNSGVTYGANYVTSMTLKQVRYYSGSRLLATDSTPKPVSLTVN